MKPLSKSLIRPGVLLLGIVTAIVVVRFWYLEEQGNFHTITPGEAYRSAQLDRDELEYYIRKYRIHSVINLLGKNENAKWHREEVSTCKDLGAAHYDIKLPSRRAPSENNIQKLVSVFRSAPRPVLIHCKAGADRSGLAAAIWLIEVDSMPVSRAKEEFSIKYGHIPIGPTHALDKFFDNWVRKRMSRSKFKGNRLKHVCCPPKGPSYRYTL